MVPELVIGEGVERYAFLVEPLLEEALEGGGVSVADRVAADSLGRAEELRVRPDVIQDREEWLDADGTVLGQEMAKGRARLLVLFLLS